MKRPETRLVCVVIATPEPQGVRIDLQRIAGQVRRGTNFVPWWDGDDESVLNFDNLALIVGRGVGWMTLTGK